MLMEGLRLKRLLVQVLFVKNLIICKMVERILHSVISLICFIVMQLVSQRFNDKKKKKHVQSQRTKVTAQLINTLHTHT